MSMRLGLPAHDQLHNFVASPAWDGAPLEAVLAAKADAMVGGPGAVLVGAVLVVDDTALPKKGSASVASRTSTRARSARTPTARRWSR
jgi:DDE superfamily endonuclease